MADIFFNNADKKLKIAQIAKLNYNQPFQL